MLAPPTKHNIESGFNQCQVNVNLTLTDSLFSQRANMALLDFVTWKNLFGVRL
jgi:hypothetical protein